MRVGSPGLSETNGNLYFFSFRFVNLRLSLFFLEWTSAKLATVAKDICNERKSQTHRLRLLPIRSCFRREFLIEWGRVC